MHSFRNFLHRVRSLARKGRLFFLFTGLGITLAMCLLFVFEPAFFHFLDNKLYDQFVRIKPAERTSNKVVIVDYDDASLAEMGQWPWPRNMIARLLQKIQQQGATSVSLDVVFPEPDRTSLDILQQHYAQDFDIELDFSRIPAEFRNNDAVLAATLKSGPFVLGYQFDFESARKSKDICEDLKPLQASEKRSAGAPSASTFLFQAPAVICNEPILNQAAQYEGFFNSMPDEDGIIRRTPLIISWKGELYPNLALSSLIEAGYGQKQRLVEISRGGISAFVLDDIRIPLDEHGQMLINYRGMRHFFPYYSASDVLLDRLPKDTFKDKIVLVGTSAPGLKDLRATPMDQISPGVEVHANVIDNILCRDFIFRPDWAFGAEAALIFVIGLVSTLLLSWTSALWSLLPLAVCSAGMFWGTLQLFFSQGLYISPLIPLITVATNFAILTLFKFWREEGRRRFYHTAFSKYVSKTVVEQLIKSPEKLSLVGEERDVTIFFSDIRGFTTLSEKLASHQVGELLRTYLTPMTRLIIQYEGTLDKYMGDAIMAFWNAPLAVEQHPLKALAASMHMLEELQKMNPELIKNYGEPLRIGIGLHTGRVRVGNMGSEDLMDYTLIGDNVNLTSRLEGLTKFYGVQIIASDAVRDACKAEFYFQEIDKVRVKGKNLPITIFTPMDFSEAEERREELESYAQALTLYRQRKFEQAHEIFRKLSQQHPDSKLLSLYEERCDQLSKQPVGDDWDQVFTHKSK